MQVMQLRAVVVATVKGKNFINDHFYYIRFSRVDFYRFLQRLNTAAFNGAPALYIHNYGFVVNTDLIAVSGANECQQPVIAMLTTTIPSASRGMGNDPYGYNNAGYAQAAPSSQYDNNIAPVVVQTMPLVVQAYPPMSSNYNTPLVEAKVLNIPPSGSTSTHRIYPEVNIQSAVHHDFNPSVLPSVIPDLQPAGNRVMSFIVPVTAMPGQVISLPTPDGNIIQVRFIFLISEYGLD
jgi:hypothetical protein